AALLEHHEQVLAQLAAVAPAPARRALARAAAAAHRAENEVRPANAGPSIVKGPPAEASPAEASANPAEASPPAASSAGPAGERNAGEDIRSPSKERGEGNGLGREGAPGSEANRHHLAPPATEQRAEDPDRPRMPARPPGKPAAPPAKDSRLEKTE